MPSIPKTNARRAGLVVALALVLAVVVVAVWAMQRLPYGDAPSTGEETSAPLPMVVLVSGYGGDGGDIEPLADALRSEGREVVIFPPVGDNTGDLVEQARLLGTFVDNELTDADGDPLDTVDVIGFSAGGVVARVWASDFGGALVARRILTIAAPHHGTRLARLAELGGFCEGACVQLVPNSALLERLNEADETPAGPEWITIWSESDRTVTPVDSASLEGSLAITVQSVCPAARTDHLQLPDSPVVLAALSSALGRGAPAVPTLTEADCQS